MQFPEYFEQVVQKTKTSIAGWHPGERVDFSQYKLMKTALHALYQPYKWLIFLPFFILSTIFFFLLAWVTVFLFGPDVCSRIFPPLWSRMNAWMTPLQVVVHGKEHIVPGQSYVVVSNHQSHYDIFMLYGWLGIDFKWVMKMELRSVPIIGYICEKMNHIFIDRSDGQSAVGSINRATRTIHQGISIIFFPEGTRSADGNLGPFKKGAFRLAVDLGLPILPVTIAGTHRVLPKGSLNLFPGRVDMIIHPPISTHGYSRETMDRLMEYTRNQIAGALPEK
jgi:1-acyl-sn-glycerol-3-phosphate acyltransferase